MEMSEKDALEVLAVTPVATRAIGARRARSLLKKGFARLVKWNGARPKADFLEITHAGAKAAGFKSLS